jgi:hypothetical protein
MCDDLRRQLRAAEQAIELLAPTFPGELVKLRCQLIEIRRTLDKYTSGRYHVLADGLAASKLIGAYYALRAGKVPTEEDTGAVLALLQAVGVIDIR